MITITAGNDYTGDRSLTLTFKNPDTGALIDLTGASIRFSVKENAADPDGSALLAFSTAVGEGITISDQTTNKGEAKLAITGAASSILAPGVYHYAVQAKDSGGRVFEMRTAYFTILRQLIQSTS